MTPDPTQPIASQAATDQNPFAALPLEDIHLPDPIGIWPLAPGWWMLILLLLIFTAASVWWLLRYLKRQRPVWRRRRHAIRAIDKLSADWAKLAASQKPQRRAKTLMQLNRILKVHCKAYRPEALSLSGESWLHFLQHSSGQTLFSTNSDALALATGAYVPASEQEATISDQLFLDARNWLKQPIKALRDAEISSSQFHTGKLEKTELAVPEGEPNG